MSPTAIALLANYVTVAED